MGLFKVRSGVPFNISWSLSGSLCIYACILVSECTHVCVSMYTCLLMYIYIYIYYIFIYVVHIHTLHTYVYMYMYNMHIICYSFVHMFLAVPIYMHQRSPGEPRLCWMCCSRWSTTARRAGTGSQISLDVWRSGSLSFTYMANGLRTHHICQIHNMYVKAYIHMYIYIYTNSFMCVYLHTHMHDSYEAANRA